MTKTNNPPTPASPSLFSKVWVIINPAAGSRRKRGKLRSILNHLQSFAPCVEVTYTAEAGDGTRLVKKRIEEGWSLIVCAGGDGTINEVMNGMMGAGADPLPPLAILPVGTGNGLAREIGLPLHPWKAYAAILNGAVRPIYLGQVRQRYFVLMGGIGFDAYVADKVERRNRFFRKLPKLLVYILFGSVALFRYSYPILSFRANGTPYQGSTGIIAKSRLIAGPFFALSPKTGLSSPILTLCLFKAGGPIGLFWTTLRLTLFGTAGKWIEYIDAAEIEADDRTFGSRPLDRTFGSRPLDRTFGSRPLDPGLIQADGEIVGAPPARFTLSERPLGLVYPR